MYCVIQRVKHASVTIDSEKISEIGHGLLILLCVVPEDTDRDKEWLAAKCAKMRLFPDEEGVMNRSVMEADGNIMVVSQFTLAGNVRKGNRPSYIGAAGPEIAVPMYEAFCKELEKLTGKPVSTGRFGADMKVELLNDGPVTIIINTKDYL